MSSAPAGARGRVPAELYRRHVAAALDVTLRRAAYLMREHMKLEQPYGHASWAYVAPAELVRFCASHGFAPPDWAAVIEEAESA